MAVVVESEVARGTPLYPELLRAADIIRERGWCQGEAVDLQGRLCIRGAVSVALTGWSNHWDDSESPEMQALYRAVGYDPDEYNDDPDRTEEDVLELMERTAWGME